jgi:hypothetical protein
MVTDNGIGSTVNNPDPDGAPRTILNDVGYWLTSHEGSVAPGFVGRGEVPMSTSKVMELLTVRNQRADGRLPCGLLANQAPTVAFA